MTKKLPTVVVAVPCHDKVDALFTYDLTILLAYMQTRMLGKTIGNAGFLMQLGTYVHAARSTLVEEFLKSDAEWLLFVDADMRFPPNALERLLAHGEKFVGINYSSRGHPYRYIAIEQANVGPGKHGGLLPTYEDSTGLEMADAIGFGFTLIHRDVLEAVTAAAKPALPFWFAWNEDRDCMVGEDVYFCLTAATQGYKPYVDHDLSKECAHLGTEPHFLRHVWETAKIAEAKK